MCGYVGWCCLPIGLVVSLFGYPCGLPWLSCCVVSAYNYRWICVGLCHGFGLRGRLGGSLVCHSTKTPRYLVVFRAVAFARRAGLDGRFVLVRLCLWVECLTGQGF